MSILSSIQRIREHIKSDAYFMTCCTISQSIGEPYFMALKRRGLMPKFKEIRNFREFKFWLIGYLILKTGH